MCNVLGLHEPDAELLGSDEVVILRDLSGAARKLYSTHKSKLRVSHHSSMAGVAYTSIENARERLSLLCLLLFLLLFFFLSEE